VESGIAVSARDGKRTCGDSSGLHFAGDGKLYIMLSDGMGTGRLAKSESGGIIELLEKFIGTGVDIKTALSSIYSALLLKSEDSGACSTIDMAVIDLFRGESEFYKYGAAPAYIKRGGTLKKVSTSTLPVGADVNHDFTVNKISLRLKEGDFVVLTSDGINENHDDRWLKTLIAEYEGISPQKLSDLILEESLSRFGRNDDMTVLSVRLIVN